MRSGALRSRRGRKHRHVDNCHEAETEVALVLLTDSRSQVRTRLAAGGRWPRTIGTPQNSLRLPRQSPTIPQFTFRNSLFLAPGTDGSNPSPSISQSLSAANSGAVSA